MQGKKFFSDDQLKKQDIETLKRWFRYKFHFAFIVAVKDVPAGQRLFRGVRCPERPNTIKRIFYPPPEKVTEDQRVNRIGQPKFYCSVAAPAVFYELHAKQGDFIALSEWETTEPPGIHNPGFHPEALRKIEAQERHITMRHQITNPIPNETKRNSIMRRRISEAFTTDVPPGKEYRYKQSIVINNGYQPKSLFLSPLRIGTPVLQNIKKLQEQSIRQWECAVMPATPSYCPNLLTAACELKPHDMFT